MATVIRRVWKSRGPTGHLVKKISYGYSFMVNGPQEWRPDARWTKEDAQNALASRLLGLGQDAPAPAGPGITFGQAVERYLQAKSRKKSIQDDTRHLTMLRVIFGAETPLAAPRYGRLWK